MKFRRLKKAEISLLGYIIYIAVLGAGIALGYKFLNGKKDEVTYKSTMDSFMQSYHEGMLKYSIDSIHANDNFANVNAKNAATFMNPSIIKLSDDETYLTSANPNYENLIKVTAAPAKDLNGNDNRRYKTMFDLSALALSNGWDKDKDEQKYTKIETEVARFFLNVTYDAVVAGEDTTLGAANTDATKSDPNNDAIIVIDKVK